MRLLSMRLIINVEAYAYKLANHILELSTGSYCALASLQVSGSRTLCSTDRLGHPEEDRLAHPFNKMLNIIRVSVCKV